ncbi:c-type cytochrome [Luteimonas sp. e5]
MSAAKPSTTHARWAAFAVLAALPVLAQSPAQVPDVVQTCVACHGADGAGMPAVGYPRLAGLDGGYMLKQMHDHAQDRRGQTAMTPIAKNLSDEDMQASTAFYAALPPHASDAEAGEALSPEARAMAERLATRGDWSRQIPACESCHGPEGIGVGSSFPRLQGQHASYAISTLNAWRKGERANDPLGLMKHVADQLSDDEINALAHYFAALPGTAEGAR